MKAVFGILALCLVASNAAVVNYEGLINDIIGEVSQIAVDTAQTLEHQYKEIVVEPNQQLEAAVQSIEDRKSENEACVAAQDPRVETVVDSMHEEMNRCGVVAAKESAVIMNDVNQATQQLVFDGYDVLMTYNKCQSYKNSVLKNTCYARLSIKATLFLKNARKSIRTLKSTPARVPVVFADADVCTHSAADNAILELDNVHAQIDACITKN